MFLLSLAVMFGCAEDKSLGGDSGGAGSGGGDTPPDPTEDTCNDDEECSDWQICEEHDCVDGDRNNTSDEAVTLSEEGATSGFINVPGDHDFYLLTATGGEFIRASIQAHDEVAEGSPQPDLFLTLYAPDGSVVTSADDYANGGVVNNYDSVLYAYMQDGGDYILEVEDANPMKEREAWGGSSYTYALEVYAWNQTTFGSSTFDEPIQFGEDGPLELQPNTWHVVGVVLEEAGDVDYVSIDYPFNDGTLYIDGVEDLSGSNANPWAALYTADELAVTQRDEVGPNGTLYHPLLDANSYVLAVADADGGGGDNHWFAVMLKGDERNTDDDGNPINVEIEPNDGGTMAHAVSMTDTVNTSGKPFSYGYGVGFADTPGDVDWYSIDVDGADTDEAGSQWLVVCMNSTRWGSSIAPDITVYAADGVTELGSAVGDLDGDPNLAIENIELTSPGETLYLQVDSGSDSAGTVDEWYILKAYVTSFEVTGGYSCP